MSTIQSNDMFIISFQETIWLFLCKIVLEFICDNFARIFSLVWGRIRTNHNF
ncbi:protein ycf2 [Phtheirospermum japonicum]|uniref:Protein ycf2 n=1 Tax=Phtheirospermum japonicum TaxID=374723 RepID=A0A830B6F5_9LAMI|nr:protein ycf2 [Phtheirospermum japonicum]